MGRCLTNFRSFRSRIAVIDVNKGNLQFEYDQVHIICPYYEPGTNENETEKYIIYNVSKVEYETCRITNPNPRIIAICDKPFNTTLVTISFRPFTPQPGGLEFKPGNDYYFICEYLSDLRVTYERQYQRVLFPPFQLRHRKTIYIGESAAVVRRVIPK